MYQLQVSKKVMKQLKKLDKPTKKIIESWIEANLYNTSNPRQHGKQLKGTLSHLWRYRIGDYRLLAEIKDNQLVIVAVELGHRREIYK